MAKTVTEKLEALKVEYKDNGLYVDVIETLLDCGSDDEIKVYMEDVLKHGCISGMVGHLIYYTDTHKFFDEFYGYIMDIISDYVEETGIVPDFKHDIKNFYAWFAFEYVVDRIYIELEAMEEIEEEDEE